MTTAYVAYCRVSTQKQGQSGLGLDAQRASVEAFTRQRRGEIVSAFVEVESGKRADRPELAKAIAAAKKAKASLLIAKRRLLRSTQYWERSSDHRGTIAGRTVAA